MKLELPKILTRRIRAISLASLLSLSLLACQPTRLYPGPPRPDSEISTILPSQSGASLRELAIDGNAVEHIYRPIHILPGHHRMRVSYQEKYEDSNYVLRNDAGSGRDGAGIGAVRVGHCFIDFDSAPGQEIVVRVTAGSYAPLFGTTPPKITLSVNWSVTIIASRECVQDGFATDWSLGPLLGDTDR